MAESTTNCDLRWLKTYDKSLGVKKVAEKLGISENEATIRISSTEAGLVLLHEKEGQKRLKSAKSSHLNVLGKFYRRQIHNTCCGVASIAFSRDALM